MLPGSGVPVVDKISPEISKALGIMGQSWLTSLFNFSWGSGTTSVE